MCTCEFLGAIPYRKESQFVTVTTHTGIAFNLLLVLERPELNYQGDSSSFPPYRCQICISYVSVLVDVTLQKE